MPGVLFSIPLTQWVRETIDKMNSSGKHDFYSWNDYWRKTYLQLGGKSIKSGSKECPKHAAFGLWRLGRIKNANVSFQKVPITNIHQEYGKNAVYAVLALNLLAAKPSRISKAGLWRQVQEKYRELVHEEPAISQQGAVTVAQTLFEEGQIVTEQE
jgi:hypothetical protein